MENVIMDNNEFFTEAKSTFKQDVHKSNKSNSRVRNVIDRNAIKSIIRNRIEIRQHKNGRVVELGIGLDDRSGNININDIDWSKGLKITSQPKHIRASEANWYNEALNELKQSYDKYIRLVNQNKQNPSGDIQSQIKALQEDMLENAEDLAEESSFPFELKNGKSVDADNKKRQAFFYIHDLLEKINEANQTKNMKQIDAARSELGALMNIKDPNNHPFEYKLTSTFCEVEFLEREYKIYPRKNTTRFIHFSGKPNLTSLNPGNEYLPAIYGDDPHETTGPQTRWLYKGMVVHFWAVENNTMSYKLLGCAKKTYGNYAYEYIPTPSDKFYMDDTESRRDQNARAVIIKTNKPLPVKQIDPDELAPKEEPVHESCLIMDNDEFFMEASKNPDIKARKRTVNNLRKLGVDRAHEVDDKKLEKGIDVNLTDSYGNKHKTKLMSQPMTTGYIDVIDRINIAPKKMISNQFDATFNHEAGHAEQQKRIGFDNIKERDYTVSDTDDYPIKCAKLFLQKNKDKMNDHDDKWTELHADYLSCRKVGFGKMIKDIYSFKRSKKEIDDSIENCIKYSEAERKEITDKFFKYTDSDGNEHTRTQKDVDECVKACEQAKEKLEHYNDILNSRLHAVFEKSWKEGLSEDYKNKLEKLRDKIYTKQDEIYTKIDNLSDSFTHNGISMKVVKKFNDDIERSIKNCNYHLKMLKAAFTTYDYRIKFIEDMKYIHDGHPGRCSMKYPPMTPADKKYMQEFTVEELFISNIITESEYVQLQERIQILTERSE